MNNFWTWIVAMYLLGVTILCDQFHFAGATTFEPCNMVQYIRFGDVFHINVFPPIDNQYQHQPYECSWIFKTYDKNCQLVLVTRNYERGNVACDEQYILIGDENKETRICGFVTPPHKLQATGRELFLTHFRRVHDGGMVTPVPSRLSGVVRCMRREVAPYQQSKYSLAAAATYDNNTCPTQERFRVDEFMVNCSLAGNCKANITAALQGGIEVGEDQLDCTPSTPSTFCHLNITVAWNAQPSNSTCNGPLEDLEPPAGLNCTVVHAQPCPDGTPLCGIQFTAFTSPDNRTRSIKDFCGAPTGNNCTVQLVSCFTTLTLTP